MSQSMSGEFCLVSWLIGSVDFMAYQTLQLIYRLIPFYTNHHNHHHHAVPRARISLTLSRHFSLSFIASSRSSGLHSCCMYVRAGRPAFARPYVGGPQEYIPYELVSASPAVSYISGSSNLDSFRDGRKMAVQLVPFVVLPPGLVQY